MAPDWGRRAQLAELMDDETVDYDTLRACLADLARVNVVTLGYRPTLAFLERLARAGRWPAGRPLEVLDVGCGYGDMLRVIARWAHGRGLAVSLTGLDRSPWSARAAQGLPSPGAPIRWITQDLFDYDGEADLVISALFTHHLDDAQLARFLAWMDRRARIGWFVNDLSRSPLAYYGFAVLARLMGWHRFVRHDGPVSIRRAFRAEDWRGLLAQAQVGGARIQPRFPFRLCVGKGA